jgi:hypothetical protein
MIADSDMTYEAAIRRGSVIHTPTVSTYEYLYVEYRSIRAERATRWDTMAAVPDDGEPEKPLPLGIFIDVRA